MICLKCGNEMKEYEQVCSKCGYNKNTISNTENPYGVKNQGIYNPNAVDKEKAQEKLDHQKQFHELVEIYIGPMYYNFKKGSFSWCAFFLGPIYFVYRKLYAVGILIYLINLGLSKFAEYVRMNIFIQLGITLMFQIFLGITFKKFYFNECMERVGKIKQQNPDLGYNQLTELVKRKGGTNLLAALLFIIPIILLIIIVIMASVFAGILIGYLG